MVQIIIKQMRVKSWSKNLLVFIPAFANQSYPAILSIEIWILFLMFCLLSSLVYIFNDIRDRDLDKNHPEKSKRPIANGDLKVYQGYLIVFICAAVVSVLASMLTFKTLIIALLFPIINLFYSLGLKNIPNLELFLVSSGYVVRCVSGASIEEIKLSFWFYMIVGFSSAILVVGKRLAELSQSLGNKRAVLVFYSYDYLKIVYGIVLSSTVNFIFLWINERFGSDFKGIVAGVLLTIVLLEHARASLGKLPHQVEFPEAWLLSKPHLLFIVLIAGFILYV